MLRNTIFLFWMSGTLLVSTIGLGAWGITQTLKVDTPTADLALSAAELAKTKSAHKAAVSDKRRRLDYDVAY